MKELSSINKYFWKYKWRFFLGICFVILSNYFRILVPKLTGFVVNTVINSLNKFDIKTHPTNIKSNNTDSLIDYFSTVLNQQPFNKKILISGAILILLAVISGFFMFLMRQSIIVMSRHIEYDQKNDIYNHYQKLDLSFYKSNSTGDLMNRISEDVSRVRMYTGPALMYFINLAAVIGFSTYFMFTSDVKLSLVALSPLPFLAIAIYYVNAVINKKSERVQFMLSNLTSNAQESYSGIRVIKSFIQENPMIQFFKKNSEDYRKNSLSLAKTEAIYFPSMSLIIGISTLITIMVGALEVANGTPGVNIGKIAEFVLYIQMLTFPVSAIGWTASMIQRAAASQKRINEFLKIIPAIKDEEITKTFELSKKIEFVKANFIYDNTGINAIATINLSIAKGQKVAIIGKTGSGKSTMAQLLLRMYDLNDGEILFDEIPIRKIKLESLREKISYVPQEVFLFSDTIKNNIRFGNEHATIEQVWEAARNAGIYDEIISFQHGFDTIVGERGITLSGGQKQRISIARALIKNPEILIFDDCLSAVDSKTENAIIQHLKQFLQSKTAIIITHRIFSSFDFDNIIILDQGKIVEMGSHETLLQQKGTYAEMYDNQHITSISPI